MGSYTCYHFLSACKTSLNISCNVDLLGKNSSHLRLSEKYFILIFKDIFFDIEFRLPPPFFFNFRTLKLLLHHLLSCVASGVNFVIILIFNMSIYLSLPLVFLFISSFDQFHNVIWCSFLLISSGLL